MLPLFVPSLLLGTLAQVFRFHFGAPHLVDELLMLPAERNLINLVSEDMITYGVTFWHSASWKLHVSPYHVPYFPFDLETESGTVNLFEDFVFLSFLEHLLRNSVGVVATVGLEKLIVQKVLRYLYRHDLRASATASHPLM